MTFMKKMSFYEFLCSSMFYIAEFQRGFKEKRGWVKLIKANSGCRSKKLAFT